MNLQFKKISQKPVYELDIQTKLADDWVIQSLNSKPFFECSNFNGKVVVSKTEILKIIGGLNDTTNATNSLIINGKYGFINFNFYEESEYNKIKSFIDERLTVLNIKKKDLIVGNLYERPNGSRFIFLGVKHLIKNIEIVDKKNLTLKKYFSNLKTKCYILNLYGTHFIEEIDNKNIVIHKDLGNNGICINEELEDYLFTQLKSDVDIFRIYDEKNISSIKIEFKEEPYNKDRWEELKKSGKLIISADGGFYKFLEHKEKQTQERVSGRPLSNVYFKYDLYQKIKIEDNQIIMLPKLKHDFLGTNSWYGNSSYTFDDDFLLKNKRFCEKSDTFNHIDNSKIFTIVYEEI